MCKNERFAACEKDECHEMHVLAQLIGRHGFLEVDDEASCPASMAVLDRRTMLCIAIEHPDQLEELIEKGAEWFLSNGDAGKLPVLYVAYSD